MPSQSFAIGDIVSWNSEAGHVSGQIRAVPFTPCMVNGDKHQATPTEPQKEIESLKE
ncbi:DUF2945 domain-containing protein, partial [Acetobacter sp.]|uniref:DUF2945 domain-containing protein n=1 Tax=Acetobacter sp. TaxID=440 RepID=UPI0039ED6CBD